MKLNFNKKHLTTALYACCVILFTIVCVYFVMHIDSLKNIISGIWAIISPVAYGAIVAYIINPILNLFERRVFISKECRAARKQAKALAISKRITDKNKLEKLMYEASQKVMERDYLEKRRKKALKKRPSVISKPKKRHRGYGHRGLSLLCTYILLVAIIATIVSVIVPQILSSLSELTSNIIRLVNAVPAYIATMREKYEWAEYVYQAVLERFSAEEIAAILREMFSSSLNYIQIAGSIISSVVVQVKNVVLIIIFSIYFLVYKEMLCAQFTKVLDALAKPRTASYVRHIFKEFDVKFGQFLQGQILDSFCIGVLSFIVFSIFRIPYAPLIAVFVGITNVIPFFGPFIGAIPSAIIIFISEPYKVIVFVIIVLVMQQIDGNIVVPRILGTTTGLKPVWVIIAITVMSGLFGIFGMFFGVPIFAVIYTLISEIVHRRLAVKLAAEVVAQTSSVDFIDFLNTKNEEVDNSIRNDS